MTQQITVGRIVRYCLSAEDAEAINRRRVAQPDGPEWPAGAQAHVGSEVEAGDHYPMIVVRVWVGGGSVNGQVFLDGNDTLWVKGARMGKAPGNWHWPPRV